MRCQELLCQSLHKKAERPDCRIQAHPIMLYVHLQPCGASLYQGLSLT